MTARMIREDFLMQSAYNAVDTYCPPDKAHLMLKTILLFHEHAQEMVGSGTSVAEIRTSPLIYKISRMKDIPYESAEKQIKALGDEIETGLVTQKGGE